MDQTASHEGTVYEGLKVTLHPAPIPKRMMAYAIDMAILSAGMYAIFLGLIFLGILSLPFLKLFSSMLSAPKTLTTIGILFLVVMVVLVLLASDAYFIIFESKKGYTLGKKIFGLQVTSLNGSRLTMTQCVLRDLFRYIDAVLFFPGLICMLLTDRNQRLGDLVADTIVTHSAHKEQAGNYLYLKQDDYLLMKEEWNVSPVPPEICDAYLKFAYPFFFQQKETGNLSLSNSWQSTAQQFIQPKSQNPVDSTSLLLFFAELCFQTVQNSQQRSHT